MNILVVIPYFAEIYGGPTRVWQHIPKYLSDLGACVDVVTTDANGSTKLDVQLHHWCQSDGYRVQYFRCWHRNDLVFSLPLFRWLFQHVAEYDIVHLNNVFAPMMLSAQWLCQLHRVPYVVTPHGMLEPWALGYKAMKKKAYFKLLEYPALQQSSAIHALNPNEAHNLQKLGLEQIVAVPTGIHPQEFTQLPEPDLFFQAFPKAKGKTIVLFLGRIDPKKGLDLLAPAFASAWQQFPDIHLVIAGPDTIGFLPTAQSYFAAAGCLEATTFTGMLTGDLLKATLAAAQLYVSPSYSEGFSMSVLEGMSAGLACIITTECNFPEAGVAGAALVVEPTVSAIEVALVSCLADRSAALSMGERARRLIAQNYTWNNTAEKLFEVYQSISSKQPLPVQNSH
jgi:glycosyltransferase involved in cell wall biosynthesis